MDSQAQWLKNALATSQVHHMPFRYSVMSDVFNSDDFQQLVLSAPSFEQLPQGKKDVHLQRRSVFIYPPSIEQFIPLEHRDLWRGLYRSVKDNAQDIKQLAISSEHLKPSEYRLTAENLSIGLRLVIENLPFAMPAHIDAPQKMAVMIIYLACNNVKNNGTYMYTCEQNEGGEAKYHNHTKLDFKVNGGVILPRSELSWHGGDWQGAGERKTIHLYFFRHKKEAAGRLRAENPFFI